MLPRALLETLADGRNHSRAALRESLALGAAEIEGQLRELASAGLELVVNGDDSLRLADRIDWIEKTGIESRLTDSARERIDSLELALQVESTNRHLLQGEPPAPSAVRIAIAEFQTAGRGRRGRSWTMPPGAGLALSAAWRFGPTPAGLAALSLAIGVAVRRAIRDLTDLEIGLKWPNDLIFDGGKLGGILVELAELPGGDRHVVAGVGINVRMPRALLDAVGNEGAAARDLSTAAPRWPIDRAALAARLIERLIEAFTDFASSGFAPYRVEWQAAHVLGGKAVELRSDAGTEYGTVIDVGADGALIVERVTGERMSVISGDVTIRAQRDVCD